jgi:hypothetical protein
VRARASDTDSMAAPNSPLLRIVSAACALAAIVGFTSPARAAVDRAPSIAASFDAFWAAARDRPFTEQQEAWDRLIERPRRDLYASVVWEIDHHRHWREDRELMLKRRFAAYPGVSREIPSLAHTLESRIPQEVARFRELFPDAPAHPPIRLPLAPNFDAKSGVLADGIPVLVFAVDSLVLEHADMSVLFPHELFHLYHATHAGIKNDGVMPDADLTLPLFAEGLATYVSSLLAPGHTDAQLLLQASLGDLPPSRSREVAARFLMDAHEKAIDPAHPEPFTRWFTGSNTNYQADLPNRTGYWLGLQLVRRMHDRFTLGEMASWKPARAGRETWDTLREIAGVNPASGRRLAPEVQRTQRTGDP